MMTEQEIYAALRSIQKQIEAIRLAMEEVRREFNIAPQETYPVLAWSSDAPSARDIH